MSVLYVADNHYTTYTHRLIKNARRFNLDLPAMGNSLTAKININGEVKETAYSLISLPLYLAGFIKRVMMYAAYNPDFQ